MTKQLITAPAYPTNNNQSQPRIPTLSYQEFQLLLDQVGIDTKAFLEAMIAELQDSTGSKGSNTIGHNSANVTADNVGDALEENAQAIDGIDSQSVKLTGNQTVAGVKTFSSSPVIPETPTQDTQAASKGYVDDVVAGVTLGQIPDNSLTESKMANEMKKQSGGVAPYDSVFNSFSADADRYVGNVFEVVACEQSEEQATLTTGTYTTSNVKIGSQAILSTLGGNSVIAIDFDSPRDFSKLNDGTTVTDDDWILVPVYVAGTVPTTLVVEINKTQDVDEFQANVGSIVSGFQVLKIKRSSFVVTGSPSWSDLDTFRMFSIGGDGTTQITIEKVQIYKDLNGAPNPFQKNGIAERTPVGAWFVGKEFNNNVIKYLGFGGYATLTSSKTYDNFIATLSVTAQESGFRIKDLEMRVDGSNYIRASIEANVLTLTVRENAVNTLYETPITVSVGETVDFVLEKQDSSVILTAYHNNQVYKLSGNTNLNGLTNLIGSYADVKQIYNSFSVTEISHAHHADIAEIAKTYFGKDVIDRDNTLRMVRSGKDSNAIFTVVNWEDEFGRIVKTSTLSGGTSPEYTTRTIEYKHNGTTFETIVTTLTYDGDGDLVSEV